MKLFSLWFILFIVLSVYSFSTKVGKVRIQILKNILKANRKKILAVSGGILFICIFCFSAFSFRNFLFIKNAEAKKISLQEFPYLELKQNKNNLFVRFSDSIDFIIPELVFILPTATKTIQEISKTTTIPTLQVHKKDSVSLMISGFHSFKNRGIRTKKLLQKRLGKFYIVTFQKSRKGSFLNIAFKGKPYDNERLFAFPVSLFARQKKIPAEYLMAFFAVSPKRQIPEDSLSLSDLEAVCSFFEKEQITPDSSAEIVLFKKVFQKEFPEYKDNLAEIELFAKTAVSFVHYYRKNGF